MRGGPSSACNKLQANCLIHAEARNKMQLCVVSPDPCRGNCSHIVLVLFVASSSSDRPTCLCRLVHQDQGPWRPAWSVSYLGRACAVEEILCLSPIAIASQAHQLHFILFPLMAQGHMIPMIDIARLSAQRGLIITVVTTPHNAARFKHQTDHSFGLIEQEIGWTNWKSGLRKKDMKKELEGEAF